MLTCDDIVFYLFLHVFFNVLFMHLLVHIVYFRKLYLYVIMSKLKKIVDESRENKTPRIDLSDRGIQNINEVPGLSSLACFLC